MTTKTINLKEYIGSECYTKLETWTQTEITNAINNAISDAELFQVVENLPTTDIKNNKIYLVLSDSPSSGNLFNVYLYVNNAWERLDGLDFDINDYYLKSETDDLLDEKVDKENGKSLTSNDFTNAYKTKLDNLETTIANSIGNLQLITVVTSLPTTDIKTNRLYLLANDKSISENLYSIYIYVNNKWEQIDKLEFDITNYYTKSETDNLLDGKCDNDDNRLTNARTPLSHTHGNIANTGAIGSDANLPIITTTNGKLTTGSFGTSANTFCQGNDSRLSDARTPTAHTHGDITNTGAIGTTANKPLITTTNGKITTGSFGTTANTFCQGNDSRLSDARTPTAHTHTRSEITDFPSIDSSMSDSSTNLVQNKIIKAYVDDQIDDVISGAVDLTGYVKDTDSRLTDARTPLSHTHGDITNTGAIGTTANKPLITTTNGKITTGSFGTTANTFCQGNDSRLSDARTPTAHTHSKSDITDFPTIPSKTSQLTNDSGFLTSVPAHTNATASNIGQATASLFGHAKASSSTPAAVTTGTASVGTDNGLYARADHSHKHPTYTSRTSNVYKITVDGSGHVSAATAPSLTYSNGLLTIGSTGTSGGW